VFPVIKNLQEIAIDEQTETTFWRAKQYQRRVRKGVPRILEPDSMLIKCLLGYSKQEDEAQTAFNLFGVFYKWFAFNHIFVRWVPESGISNGTITCQVAPPNEILNIPNGAAIKEFEDTFTSHANQEFVFEVPQRSFQDWAARLGYSSGYFKTFGELSREKREAFDIDTTKFVGFAFFLEGIGDALDPNRTSPYGNIHIECECEWYSPSNAYYAISTFTSIQILGLEEPGPTGGTTGGIGKASGTWSPAQSLIALKKKRDLSYVPGLRRLLGPSGYIWVGNARYLPRAEEIFVFPVVESDYGITFSDFVYRALHPDQINMTSVGQNSAFKFADASSDSPAVEIPDLPYTAKSCIVYDSNNSPFGNGAVLISWPDGVFTANLSDSARRRGSFVVNSTLPIPAPAFSNFMLIQIPKAAGDDLEVVDGHRIQTTWSLGLSENYGNHGGELVQTKDGNASMPTLATLSRYRSLLGGGSLSDSIGVFDTICGVIRDFAGPVVNAIGTVVKVVGELGDRETDVSTRCTGLVPEGIRDAFTTHRPWAPSQDYYKLRYAVYDENAVHVFRNRYEMDGTLSPKTALVNVKFNAIVMVNFMILGVAETVWSQKNTAAALNKVTSTRSACPTPDIPGSSEDLISPLTDDGVTVTVCLDIWFVHNKNNIPLNKDSNFLTPLTTAGEHSSEVSQKFPIFIQIGGNPVTIRTEDGQQHGASWMCPVTLSVPVNLDITVPYPREYWDPVNGWTMYEESDVICFAVAMNSFAAIQGSCEFSEVGSRVTGSTLSDSIIKWRPESIVVSNNPGTLSVNGSVGVAVMSDPIAPGKTLYVQKTVSRRAIAGGGVFTTPSSDNRGGLVLFNLATGVQNVLQEKNDDPSPVDDSSLE
jgi:hypothetical protein